MDNPEQTSNANDIRLKRVAKLQQQLEEQRRAAEATRPSPESAESSRKPSQQSPIQVTSPTKVSPTPSGKSTPSTPARTTVKPESQTTARVAPAKSFEDWQNEALSRILQVTFNLDTVYKQGRCVYLHELVSELESENEPKPFRLHKNLLDRVIVARLSLDANEPLSEYPDDIRADLNVLHFDYLLNCWKRAHEILRNTMTRSKNLEKSALDQRLETLEMVKGLLVSYSGLVIQMPDMFPQLQSPVSGVMMGPAQLVPRLLSDRDTPSGLPSEYINELVARFNNDGLDSIIGEALVIISRRLRECDILGDYQPSLKALAYLCCEYSPIAAMLPTLPEFDPPNATAQTIEDVSLLGPFFRLTAYADTAPHVSDTLFQNAGELYSATMESTMNGVRSTVHNVQRTLFNVINSIVRSSPAAREGVLAYFAHVLRLNEKRAQMQVDMQYVATDGFMHNISAVMLELCNPFMDVKASKINKIDIDYFHSSKRIDVKEETKINASKEESDEYYSADRPTKEHNFITEIFFLTLNAMHLGPVRAFNSYNELQREYSEMKRQYDRLESDVARTANTPEGVMQEYVFKRIKARMELITRQKMSYETMLLDEEFLNQSMRFYNLVMAWIIRSVDPLHTHPWTVVKLPLPSTIPKEFALLPEWVIEDVVEFFIALGKHGYRTHVFRNNPHDEIAAFTITFLRNTKYIKNPYLKAKLVEILFFFTYPIAKDIPGELEAMLNSHSLSLEHLVPSLMTFYVEVEQTGASSQFYDKFNIRYNISHVMKTIWNHPTHRARLREESKNSELFTRFVNMLMSDVTYLLDESLSKLSEIHQIQTEMANSSSWEAQNPQQRQERENNLRTAERQAQSYVALGNETVHMLQYLTAEVTEPFMVNEIVDRLAAMLDYNLAQLVGPKCTELKVQNPEKYHFEPRVLLSEIIDIYLHLNCQPFIEAVARDGRSYRKEYFSRAASIMLKYRLKSQDEVAALELFINKVEKAIQSGVEEEEELGDVPDEFLDPIFFSLMEDPVLLPTSNVIVDRSTIRAHLLGDSRDPFSRAPLTMDMVQPATELKAKIQAWKNQKKNGGAAMDVSE